MSYKINHGERVKIKTNVWVIHCLFLNVYQIPYLTNKIKLYFQILYIKLLPLEFFYNITNL